MAKLDIEVNVKGEEQIKSLQRDITSLEKATDSFKRVAAATAVVATAFGAAMYAVGKKGFEFNKSIEEGKAGLVALSVATQNQAIPAIERYAEAQKVALVTSEELQKVNAETPHTLDQTTKIYNAMFVSMRNAGASVSEMVELTRSLSIASGAAGIEFNSLLAGVDGLATGTVLANSDLGRFLSSLGLTNEALKESDNVVALVTERLKDFKAQGLATEAISNFDNAWSQLMGKITEDAFDGGKRALDEISSLLNNLSSEDIEGVKSAFSAFAIAAITALEAVATVVIKLSQGFNSLGARIAGVAYRLENGIFLSDKQSAALERMYEATKAQNAALDTMIDNLDRAKEAIVQNINAGTELVTVTDAEREAILNTRNESALFEKDIKALALSTLDVVKQTAGYKQVLDEIKEAKKVDAALTREQSAALREQEAALQGIRELSNYASGMTPAQQDWQSTWDASVKDLVDSNNTTAESNKFLREGMVSSSEKIDTAMEGNTQTINNNSSANIYSGDRAKYAGDAMESSARSISSAYSLSYPGIRPGRGITSMHTATTGMATGGVMFGTSVGYKPPVSGRRTPGHGTMQVPGQAVPTTTVSNPKSVTSSVSPLSLSSTSTLGGETILSKILNVLEDILVIDKQNLAYNSGAI